MLSSSEAMFSRCLSISKTVQLFCLLGLVFFHLHSVGVVMDIRYVINSLSIEKV